MVASETIVAYCLQRAERLFVQLAVRQAQRSGRCRLRQGLADDRPQGGDATPAIRTATETFIDRAWRPRAHPAGNDIPDFCVGQDIARTYDHSGTGRTRRGTHGQRFSNSLLNNTQDKNCRLQMFQNRIAVLRNLDSLKITSRRKADL